MKLPCRWFGHLWGVFDRSYGVSCGRCGESYSSQPSVPPGKRLICRLIGHSLDPMWMAGEEWPLACFRCNRTFEDEASTRSDLGFWLSWYNARGRFSQSYRRFWRGPACPECGKRGCDDCLPF